MTSDYPEKPVEQPEPRLRMLTLQHNKLLPQGQILQEQVST